MAIEVKTETLEDGREFTVTRSTIGMMIQNEDGEKYAEAWDIPILKRTYTETDEPIETDDDTTDDEALYAEAARIMLGDA